MAVVGAARPASWRLAGGQRVRGERLLLVVVAAILAGAWLVGGMVADASRVGDGDAVALPELPPPATTLSTAPPAVTKVATRVTIATTITTTTPAAPVVAQGDVWDRLAQCESGGRWHIHDAVHEGGLQFAVGTWDDYKPAGFPEGAHQATREQQILVAVRVRDGVPGTSDPYLNAQGWGAWPTCSRRIGLR